MKQIVCCCCWFVWWRELGIPNKHAKWVPSFFDWMMLQDVPHFWVLQNMIVWTLTFKVRAARVILRSVKLDLKTCSDFENRINCLIGYTTKLPWQTRSNLVHEVLYLSRALNICTTKNQCIGVKELTSLKTKMPGVMMCINICTVLLKVIVEWLL